MKKSSIIYILLLPIFGLSSCWNCYEQKVGENFYLYAPDVDEQLSFCYKDENNKLTEIVSEGVFAIGQDSSYFILKKHPVEEFVIDTTQTEYYIIPVRYTPKDTMYKIEPLSKTEFEEKRILLKIDKRLAVNNLNLYYHNIKK